MFKYLKKLFVNNDSDPHFNVYFVIHTPKDYAPKIYLKYERADPSKIKTKQKEMEVLKYATSIREFYLDEKHEINIYKYTKYSKKHRVYKISFLMKSDKSATYDCSLPTKIEFDSSDKYLFVFDIGFRKNYTHAYTDPPCERVRKLETQIFGFMYYFRKKESNYEPLPFLYKIAEEFDKASKDRLEEFISFFFYYIKTATITFEPKDYIVIVSFLLRIPSQFLSERISYFDLEIIDKINFRLKEIIIDEKLDFLYKEVREFWADALVKYYFYYKMAKFLSMAEFDQSILKEGLIFELISYRNQNKMSSMSKEEYHKMVVLFEKMDWFEKPEMKNFLIDVCPDFESLIKASVVAIPVNEPEKGIPDEYIEGIEKLFIKDNENIERNFELMFVISQLSKDKFPKLLENILKKTDRLSSLIQIAEMISSHNFLNEDLKSSIIIKFKKYLDNWMDCKAFFKNIIFLDNKKNALAFLYDEKDILEKLVKLFRSYKLDDLLICAKAHGEDCINCLFFQTEDRLINLILEKSETFNQLKDSLNQLLSSYLELPNGLTLSQKIINRALEINKGISNLHVELVISLLKTFKDEGKKQNICTFFFEIIKKTWKVENMIAILGEIKNEKILEDTFLTFAQEKIQSQNFKSDETFQLANKISKVVSRIVIPYKLDLSIFKMILDKTQIDIKIDENLIKNFLEIPQNHLIYAVASFYASNRDFNSEYIGTLQKISQELYSQIGDKDPKILYNNLNFIIEKPERIEKLTSFLSKILDKKITELEWSITQLRAKKEGFDLAIGRLEVFIKRYFHDIPEIKPFLDLISKIQTSKASKKISSLIIPEELNPFISDAVNFSKYSNSTVFANLFKLESTNKPEANNVGSRLELLKIVEKNYLEIPLKLNPKPTEHGTLTVSVFDTIFKGSNVIQELDLLEEITKIKLEKNTKESISRCLEYVYTKQEIIDNISALFECIKMLGIKQTYYTENMLKSQKLLQEENKDKSIYHYLEVNENLLRIDQRVLDANSRTMRLVRTISKSKALFDLLKDRDEISIRRKAENVGEQGLDFITGKTIKDLLQARNLFAEFNRIKIKEKEDNSFLYNIYYILQDKKFENSGFFIDECNKVLTGIIKLFNEKTQEVTSKQKVLECYIYSEYKFEIDDEDDGFKVKVKAGKNKVELSFQDIIEAKMRSMLLLRSEKTEEIETEEKPQLMEEGSMDQGSMDQQPQVIQKEKKSELSEAEYERIIHQSFVDVIELIQDIVKKINSLYFSGYPKIPIRPVTLSEGQAQNMNIREYLEELKKMKNNWNELLVEKAQDYYSLTYLYGRQISIFYSYLIENKRNLKEKIIHLLKYIGAKDKEIDLFTKESWQGMEIEEFITMLGEFLDQYVTFEDNKFANSKIKKGTIVSINASSEDFENFILSTFISEVGRCPTPHEILTCHRDTKWEWIVMFLYRIYLCKSSKLFVLAKVELLPPNLQSRLLTKIAEFQQGFQDSIKARIAIVTRDPKSLIMVQLKKMEIMNHSVQLMSNEMIKPYIKSISSRVRVITSEESGYGKTHKIKKFARDTKKKIFFFPVYDEIDLKSISKRTFGLSNQPNKLIHLGLFKVEDIPLLNQYLFNILILNGCYLYDTISVLDEDLFFYIEIAPTYGQILFNSLRFLHSFSLEVITKNSFLKEELDFSFSKTKYAYFGNYFSQIKADPNYLLNNEIRKENLNPVSSAQVKELLMDQFIKNDASITFYQINAFLNILENQLEKFSNSDFLTLVYLLNFLEIMNKPNQRVPVTVRNTVFQSIIGHTHALVQSSYSQAFLAQASTFGSIFPELKELLKNNKKIDPDKAIIRAPNEMLIILHDFGTLSVPILSGVTLPNDIDDFLHTAHDYQDPKKLVGEALPQYYITTLRRITENAENIIGKKYDESKMFDFNYVVLQDNFYKMVLIYLKFEAKIPVIIMGETGCGKTSLVKYLAQNILQIRFDIISFHAGITESKLIKIIEKVIHQAEEDPTSYWIILDEVNTCNCLGLISELLCNRSLLGEALPENIFFIATCNPYRQKNETNEQIGLVKKVTGEKKKSLAYTVNMLPHNMMNFVFDFGSLNPKDEIEYIKKIINMVSPNYLEVTCKCIQESQAFLRNQGETSSASLREGKRFVKLFEWFKKKFEFVQTQFYYSETRERVAIILSLFICYYVRLTTRVLRKNYLFQISEIWKSKTSDFGMKPADLYKYFDDAQNYVLDQINLPHGIAKNKSLKENLFTALVCLVNKIPLLICGKPGCSKTLAIRLIHENMRGPDSEKKFFKDLPRVFSVSYQGSHSSTSEGIEAVFERAKKIQKENAENYEINFGNVITMVFFDEIGLAEDSENNPLKVLHNLLEPVSGKAEDEVGFIGISNWKLDAAKMNRAVFLARPDPDEEELIQTAKEILESYPNSHYYEYKDVLEALARAYYDHRIKQSSTNFADFHGTRDFYSLIKQVSSKFTGKLNPNRKTEDIVRDAIERNFGGLPGTSKEIKIAFNGYCPRYHVVPDDNRILDIIQSNYNDQKARYLMIITSGSYGTYLLHNHFTAENKLSRILVGSKLKADNNKEEYIFRTLKVITDHMEKGEAVILQNLESIYPSLYDLFNQNFEEIDHRKSCRIALASTTNPMRYVDEKFRCTIIVDDKDLVKMDPPFLNRFEKQRLKLENTMSNDQRELARQIIEELKSMLTPRTPNKFFMPFWRLVSGMGPETVLGLIIKNHAEQKNWLEVKEESYKQIISLASMEFISALSCSVFRDTKPEEYAKLSDYYFQNHHESIKSFLNAQDKIPGPYIRKYFIYTYSNILEVNEDFKGTQISSYEQEKVLQKNIEGFLNNPRESLFILTFEEEDSKHLPMVKSLIEGIISDKEKYIMTSKKFVIVFNIKKELRTPTNFFPIISDWKQVFIDILNPTSKMKFEKFLGVNFQDICREYFATMRESDFQNLLGKAFMRLNYSSLERLDCEISIHLTAIINKITAFEKMFLGLKVLIMREINNHNWEDELLYNEKYCNNYESLEEAFENYIKTKLVDQLTKILWVAENNSMIDFLLYEREPEVNDKLIDIFFYNLEPLFKNFGQVKLLDLKQENPVNKIWGMRLSFSYHDIEKFFPELEMTAREVYKIEVDPKLDQKGFADICWKYENLHACVNKFESTKTLQDLPNHLSSMLQKEYYYDVINYITQKKLNCKESYKYLIYEFYNIRKETFNKAFEGSKIELKDHIINSGIWFLGFETQIKCLLNIFSSLNGIEKNLKNLAEGLSTHAETSKLKPSVFNVFDISLDFIASQIIPTKENILLYQKNLKEVSKVLNSLKLSFLEILKVLRTVTYSKNFEVMVLIKIIQNYFKDKEESIYPFLSHILDSNPNNEFKISEQFLFQLDEFIKKKANQKPEEKSMDQEANLEPNIMFEVDENDPMWSQFKSDILVNLASQSGKDINNYKKYLNQILSNYKYISEASVFISGVTGLNIAEFKSQPNEKHPFVQVIMERLENVKSIELIISEIVTTKFYKIAADSVDPLEFLKANREIFSTSYTTFAEEKSKKLQTLYHLAKIKSYTKVYFDQLDTPNFEKIPKEVNEAINKVASSTDKFGDLFRIYFLRELKQKYGSIVKLETQLSDKKLFDWIRCIYTDEPKQLIDVPIYSKTCKEYNKIADSLKNMTSNGMDMQKTLYEANYNQDPQLNEALCLVFCNEIYLTKHSEFAVQRVKTYIAEDKNFVESRSKETYAYLDLLANSFGTSKLLSLNLQDSVKKIELASIISRIGSFFFSHLSVQHAFSSLFENGLENVFKNLSKFFPPGGDDNTNASDKYFPIYHLWSKELVQVQSQYGPNGMIYKIKNENVYPCRCSCGFLYTIGDCTRPSGNMKCLDCGLMIGGEAYNVLVRREGHKRLELVEIKQIVQDAYNKIVGGYEVRDEKMWVDDSLTMRDLSRIGYRLLNFIFDVIIYLIILMTKDEDSFKKPLKLENNNTKPLEFLEKKIGVYWETLLSLLNAKNNSYILVNLILNELFEYATKVKPIQDNNSRMKFESEFDEKILSPILLKMNDKIDEHKKSVSKLIKNEEKNVETEEKILDLVNDVCEPKAPNLQLLKLMIPVQKGSFEDLKFQFTRAGHAANYPLIQIFFEEEEWKLHLLDHLHSIISLTNLLIDQYSFAISREESTKKTLKDAKLYLIQRGVDEKKIESMIDEFIKAWNAVSHICVSYTCNHKIVPQKIDWDKPLSFVLPYNMGAADREQGLSMLSAFETLGKMQNNILGAVKESNILMTRYNYLNEIDSIPVQMASKSDIISIKALYSKGKESIKDVMDDYWVLTCPDGKYPKITYDYRRLEEFLARTLLLGKKILQSEEYQIRTMQFQFELNTMNNHMIEDFAARFGWERIPKDKKDILEGRLLRLSESSLMKVHPSIENIIYFFLGSNFTKEQNLNDVLDKVPNHLEISGSTKDIIRDLRITFEEILDLYTFAEETIKEGLFKLIKKEIKNDIHGELTNKLDEALPKFKLISLQHFANTIRRFCCRYLIGNFGIISPLSNIIFNMPALWDLDLKASKEITDFEAFLLEQYEFFPRDILIINAFGTYQYLVKKIEEERIKKDQEANLKKVNKEIEIESTKFEVLTVEEIQKDEAEVVDEEEINLDLSIL